MMENSGVFIEQAEYIQPADFIEWSSDHPSEAVIIKRLTQSGAKLLTGPRGCGKTTLMLKAYNKLSKKGVSGAFPVYVNFKSSLKLEPVYKSKANGGFWFSQWMYLKIYEGIYSSFKDMGYSDQLDLKVELDTAKKVLGLLELGEIDKAEKEKIELTTYDLEEDIDYVMSITGKPRCVLLLDDAAHAFSPEQQHDFFEFFRKIKNRRVSPKAAIYPGVTNFPPTFNVGHDAEEINAWVNPEGDNYMWFMTTMLSRRLPQAVYERLSKEESLLTIMCYSAFGIPRILLNMVRSFYSEEEVGGSVEYKISLNRTKLMAQVKDSNKRALAVYASLEKKLPTYINYVEEGDVVIGRIIDLIKTYNKEKSINRKSISIAVKKELSSDLKKILGFFQYAGLASHKGQVSRGEKGVFEIYIINLAALVDNNAILATKAAKTDDIAIALKSRNAHEFTRTKSDYLIPENNEPLKLKMPACQSCGEERSSDEARFCSNCGAPLKTASIYEELVNESIDVLPLTPSRIKSIKSKSGIRLVRDILHDIGHKEIRTVPQIGSFWAAKIYQLAEEYIS
ncbi:zinc ribbon domain-containing protein [Bacterioplanes sanyensis]|nr:zinc-ribbon domain-containing protein [Bacterioplanes sanyensis]